MGVAPLVAEVLARQQVRATFFLANEKTLTGGTSLDDTWAPWWKARAADGHVFAAHTFDHVYLDGPARCRLARLSCFKPSAQGRVNAPATCATWTAAQYCSELQRSADRSAQAMTGQRMSPHLFRAWPGGQDRPPSCWPPPRPVAGSTCPGARPGSWVTSYPAIATPTMRSCCSVRCDDKLRKAVTSCSPTWVSGRGKIPGRLRCWSP